MDYDVVIPVRDGELYIERAIFSVKNQTLQPAQVIIVNDGSKDSTSQIVRSLKKGYEAIQLIEIPPTGLSFARNTGILASNSRYIALLDCDDLWTSIKMENQMKFFEVNPDISIVFSGCNIYNEATKKMHKAGENFDVQCNFYNVLTQRYRVIGSASSATVDSNVFKSIGLFDSKLKYGEDYDFWVRASQMFQIAGLKNRDVVITKRRNSMQNSNHSRIDRFKNAFLYLQIWEKYYPETEKYLGDLPRLMWPDLKKAAFVSPKSLLTFKVNLMEKYPHYYNEIFPNRKSLLKFIIIQLINDLAKAFNFVSFKIRNE